MKTEAEIRERLAKCEKWLKETGPVAHITNFKSVLGEHSALKWVLGDHK